MFRKFLNPDNALMITMTQITDCIFLSIFWLLGCIPVVTVGTSFAALYDATYRGFRQGDKHCWGRFLQVYRDNWKSGILPTVIFLTAATALTKILIGLWNTAVAGNLSWMVFSGAAFAGILVVGILSVLFPMLSRFENSFPALLKNTLFLSMANLPRTLALGLLNSTTVLLCAVYVLPLFFMPSLAALIGSLLIEPMFKPFMPAEEASP
jgi:uncharacterized membrane protein YesL